MKKSLRNFLIAINLIDDRSDEEKLSAVLNDQRRKNFLDDITHIRTIGDYIPNYNVAPKFTDVKIEGIPNWMPRTVVNRPIEYRRIEDWRESIRTELRKISGMNDNQLSLF